MSIKLAQLPERRRGSRWIDFVVFDTRSPSGVRKGRVRLLPLLRARVRSSNLRIGQAALAFMSGGALAFLGGSQSEWGGGNYV